MNILKVKTEFEISRVPRLASLLSILAIVIFVCLMFIDVDTQYSLNISGILHRLVKIDVTFVKTRMKYEQGLLNLRCVRLDLKNPEVILAV